MNLIQPAKINKVKIKKEKSFFSRTVSFIVTANLLVLGMIYFTMLNMFGYNFYYPKINRTW